MPDAIRFERERGLLTLRINRPEKKNALTRAMFARLRMPFVNLGLCPEFGSSLILPRLLGHAKAAQLLLLGEGFSGEQAAWGIATEALGSGEAALAKAREMALQFEALPAEAVRISKQLMKAPGREQLRKLIEEEGALFTQRLRSPEAMAALSAFIKRH
jgi:enoyl-CoA hydratase/carnithine racemase